MPTADKAATVNAKVAMTVMVYPRLRGKNRVRSVTLQGELVMAVGARCGRTQAKQRLCHAENA
jgi:hypothetical protein